MVEEKNKLLNDIIFIIMSALEIGLPVLWLGYDQAWARTVWVALTGISTCFMIMVYVIRAYAIHKAGKIRGDKVDLSMPIFSPFKMTYRSILTGGFVYIMLMYAHHPLLATLMMVLHLYNLYQYAQQLYVKL